MAWVANSSFCSQSVTAIHSCSWSFLSCDLHQRLQLLVKWMMWYRKHKNEHIYLAHASMQACTIFSTQPEELAPGRRRDFPSYSDLVHGRPPCSASACARTRRSTPLRTGHSPTPHTSWTTISSSSPAPPSMPPSPSTRPPLAVKARECWTLPARTQVTISPYSFWAYDCIRPIKEAHPGLSNTIKLFWPMKARLYMLPVTALEINDVVLEIQTWVSSSWIRT